jgi:hypothetical protein
MYSIFYSRDGAVSRVRGWALQEGKRRKERNMLTLIKAPKTTTEDTDISEIDRKALESLVSAMGKRLQSEYVEGAIPYLRKREPELWVELERLDGEESVSALLAYERLFFEGLRRYVAFLEKQRKAA